MPSSKGLKYCFDDSLVACGRQAPSVDIFYHIVVKTLITEQRELVGSEMCMGS